MIKTVSVFGTLPEPIRISSLIRLLVSAPTKNFQMLPIGKHGKLLSLVLESSASSSDFDFYNKKTLLDATDVPS